ncbi:MAG: hypothetical protein HYY11_01845 [Candidatus Methylomirabilis oxyfera]|nr:hypothetical protein [Candidatus Methylomirabilis oxyfera]
MTPTALLSELQNQGVTLHPRGDKLAFGPRDKVTPELKAKIVQHKEDLLRLLQPGRTLADLYRKYWSKPETDPLETFKALHREIDHLEQHVGADTAWRTLEEAAKRWYQEKARCPFCGKDELHLSGRG